MSGLSEKYCKEVEVCSGGRGKVHARHGTRFAVWSLAASLTFVLTLTVLHRVPMSLGVLLSACDGLLLVAVVIILLDKREGRR